MRAAHRVLVVAMVVAAAGPALATESAVAIVSEGDPAGVDTTFATLGRPRVVSTGRVVFDAFIEGLGIGSDNDRTIWLGGQAVLQMLCQEGSAYPHGVGLTARCPALDGVVSGGSTAAVRVFGTDILAGDGVTTANDTIRTMMAGTVDGSVLVAREGDPAPGTDAAFDQAFGVQRVDSSGTVAFSAALRGGSSASGIWAGPSSSVGLQVKAGDPAPGLGAAFQGFSQVSLSPSGYLAFRGHVASGEAGLYRHLSGQEPQLVAGTGTAMPGGGSLLDVSSSAVGPRGTIAFQGSLAGSSTGVWAGSVSGVRDVAVPGQAAPDAGSFVSVGAPSIGGSDDICFFAQLSVGTDGLYCELGGTLQALVRESDTPPALAAGETVGDLVWSPVVNRHGQVLFLSQVSSGGGSSLTWWLRDTAGQLRVLAREGAAIELQPDGVVKTVATLDLPTGDYPHSVDGGSATALNDRGEVVFHARFSDGGAAVLLARPELLPGGDVFADDFELGTSDGWSVVSGLVR